MMKSFQKSKEESLLEFFRKKRVVTVQGLMKFSQLSLSTVKRRLISWKTYRSYNSNGSYHVLADIPKFSSDGIWHFRGIHFSKHGGLKQTIIHLISYAESGLGVQELEALLKTPLQEALSIHFKESSQLNRIMENGRYIYFSKDPLVYSAQTRKREELKLLEAKEQLPSDAKAIVVLVELIRHPADTLEQISTACS